MLIESPKWLNTEFMQKVLRSSENDVTIEVKDMTIHHATTIGDNYMSDMLRVNVVYSRNESLDKVIDEISLIIKIAPSGGNKDVVEELGLFNTEINMMEDTLVKMNELMKEEGHPLSPRTLYTAKGNKPLIVMQDLLALGFRMGDRRAGLDLDHGIHVMRGLARFHAASVAIREKHPKAVLGYNKNPVITHEGCRKFQKNIFNGIVKEILNWQELGSSRQYYSEQLAKISNNWAKKYAACITPKEDEFVVLNHGDCWVNNMLFKYDNDMKVIDHIFVDFQICFLSSPAVDLLTFMYSSLSEDVIVHHYDTLLEEYLSILTKTMARLDCTSKAPDMASLKNTLKKYQIIGVAVSCLYMPFMLIDKSEAKGLHEIFEAGELYSNPAIKTMAFRKAMLRLLPQWNANGVFDH